MSLPVRNRVLSFHWFFSSGRSWPRIRWHLPSVSCGSFCSVYAICDPGLTTERTGWILHHQTSGFVCWYRPRLCAPAVCGSFHFRKAKKWMREQRLLSAIQPAGEHRRVLWASSLLRLVCLSVFAKSFRLFSVEFSGIVKMCLKLSNCIKANFFSWFSNRTKLSQN